MFRVVGLIISFTIFVNLTEAQVSITTASGSKAPKGPYYPGQVIFEEHFNKLDFETWQHENTLAGGGNWEFQWYTNNRSNSYVEDGIFHIRPTLLADDYGEEFLSSGTISLWDGVPTTTCTNNRNWGCERRGWPDNYLNPVKSARVNSFDSFSFKYGILETRVKIPAGDWIWPAVWLMPKHSAYSTWPSSGEIDLLESRGNRELYSPPPNSVNIGVEEVSSTLHYGPSWDMNGYEKANFHKRQKPGFDRDFHIYRLGWTENSIEFAVDDTVIGRIVVNETYSMWEHGNFEELGGGKRFNPWKGGTQLAPFDEEFYIILNLAVGGTNGFFPDGFSNGFGPKPWDNNSGSAFKDFWEGRVDWLPTWRKDDDSTHLQIDYIKVTAV